MEDSARRISIVTPAYNESKNLPLLYSRLCAVLGQLPVDWEWVVVDDHSSDETFSVLAGLSGLDRRVRALRLSRNSGSHLACTCGLREASGDCAVVMAADLQDPPETLPSLIERWRGGAQVVWAVRGARPGESILTIAPARAYYWIMRHVAGLKDMSATGADFFLLDRSVLIAFREFRENNASIMSLILWMGFRQDSIAYEKQTRLHGASNWGLEKKLKLAVDSIAAYTYLPIRVMSYAGFVVALLGFLGAAITVVNAFRGHPIQGWPSLMVAILVLGGMQMMMMGILGEYLWRTLDEVRRRPPYLIEAAVGESRFSSPPLPDIR